MQQCSWPGSVEDILCETMVVYLMRKE
jgi:hypothetical protein